ncbi:hypothetical protein [Deinococcus sp. ME38]|uniref:hypothetical protein n=1 Tax=Deinococcus sp. ME38 TaxID=3400344 RepID=UPI003B58E7A8
MPGLIKLTGTTFTNPNLKPGSADQLLSLFPTGNLMAYDFSNPVTFPAQGGAFVPDQVFKSLGGGTDLVLTATTSGSHQYFPGLAYSGGGLNFLNGNAGGNAESIFLRTQTPRLNLSGKKRVLMISWVSQVDLGASRQFFAGIMGQARTTNGAAPAADLAEQSWVLSTQGNGLGARFLIFQPGTANGVGITFSTNWVGKRQMAVLVDYVAGLITGYVNGVVFATQAFSTGTYGSGFPTVATHVGIGSWGGATQIQGAFQGKHYRHLMWDMENSAYDPAQIVARDYEFNNAKFS